MNSFQKLFSKIARKTVSAVMGSDVSQELNTASGAREAFPGMAELCRAAAAEGCVLLRNEGGALPLSKEKPVAVFGRCQIDTFYMGYGSGGDVHPPYTVSILEGLENAGANLYAPLRDAYCSWTSSKEHAADPGFWAHWPQCHPEMPIAPELLDAAAKECDTALAVIGRAAGESFDLSPDQGGYLLTDEERTLLAALCEHFEKTVLVLNIGNLIDLSFLEEIPFSAVLIVWQGGMETGNAAADVLFGAVSPCGKLADTAARSLADYPSNATFGGKETSEYLEDVFVGYRYFDTCAQEKIIFPFGFGLSYSAFSINPVELSREKGGVSLSVAVENIGAAVGKEALDLYVSPPREGLRKPIRVLASFAKTKLLAPGECETLLLSTDDRALAAFDESKSAFVLEEGEYQFYVNQIPAGSFRQKETKILETYESITEGSEALRDRILSRLPKAAALEKGKRPDFRAVLSGNLSLEGFAAALTARELEALTRGHGMMNSSFGPAGNAGSFGGILPSLQKKGVEPIITCDGPSGLRLARFTSLLPCAAALAASRNAELIEALYTKVGEEMVAVGADVLLGPGLNLHRHPLCGRNFEYYSEDPLLSGKMAAAAVRGIQKSGRSACPKHFACNNQEYARTENNSVVSERALREIYLRSFELCVKEGKPLCLMTSYNKVNGVWSHYNYDLATTVLRREWGYEGLVMTDWWMRSAKSPEFPNLRDNAYRVRAGVDVLMPGASGHLVKKYKSDGTLTETLGQRGGITRAELERSACNTLRLALHLQKHKSEPDLQGEA